MAEQSRHDVVNQTRSGGDLSPSDVPASKPGNYISRGDAEEVHTLDQHRPTNRDMSAPSQGKTDGQTGSTTTTTGATGSEVNGISKNNQSGNDAELSPQHADGNGGSDTDTGRIDIRASKDEAQHSRTSSVKRPASFKPVSFAKFSVTKPPGTSTNSKFTNDKAPFSTSTSSSPSPQQSSRPRLVAKTTSGLRDFAPRTFGAGSRNGSGTPDPNQVWNKNRPAQPPPTKHLTDEELKQQYGIHMTSRIQADGEEKESKWADIDDDEDDWAPETIEWNDGTKITLTQTEASIPVDQARTDTKDTLKTQNPPGSSTQPPVREAPKLLAPKTIKSLGPNATILRLGANAEKQQAKASGEFNKGQNDTDTSASKGSVPKSPWAPLPPIEKAPPITVNQLGQTQRPSRFFHGERPGPEPPVAAPLPTKEIAADDFNRSWRETSSAAPRELYNSHSGRYEPVAESRRGPPRTEAHFRPSSLLQRPMHGDQLGPAEPSAAFQTSRSSAMQEPGSWGRRRASSNVSGGSGGTGRRMSVNKGDFNLRSGELPPARRASQQTERSTSPRRSSLQKGPYIPRGVSPGRHGAMMDNVAPNHYAPQGPPGSIEPQLPADAAAPQSQVPPEDPVAMQQRIMREKREMARQRRLEQEAKEEAAKQERIRLKLEAMGPPPTDKKVQSPSTEAVKPSTATAQSPPKPPVPEPSGEPKQYGMMKVHHPETVKKLVGSSDRAPDTKQFPSGPQNRKLPSPRETKPAMVHPINGVRPSTETSPIQVSESLQEPSNEKGLHWKGPVSTTAPYSPWPGAKIHPHHPPATLWGSPNNDRALGNGTFDRNLTGFPPRDLSSRGGLSLPDQPPIGSPANSAENIIAPERLQQQLSNAGRSMVDTAQTLPPLPSPEQRPGRSAAPDTVKPISRPGPIGPPSSQTQKWQQPQLPRRSEETAAWHDFHAVARRAEAEENERFHRDLKAMREEEARTGIKPSLQVTFNETWRQVKTGDQAGQRNIIGVAKSAEQATTVPPLHGLDSAADGLPFSDHSNKQGPTIPGRGSRFFPQGSDQQKRLLDADLSIDRSPSPPPPEEISSHPVFTRDSTRPLVHLPAPKPRVKFPPRVASPPAAPPATFASMVASGPQPRSQPIASTSSWQDRFNGLFGKKPSPGGKSALAVAPVTKEPFEALTATASASVSLPHYDDVEPLRNAGKVTSKEVEDEEAIFEDREAGSLPVVKVPNMAPQAAWQPAPPPSQQRHRSRFQKPVQAQSAEPYNFGPFEKDSASTVPVVIHLPGKEATKTLTIPKKGGNSNSRSRQSNYKHRKGVKSEGPHQGSRTAKKPPPSATSGASSRGSSSQGNWASRVAGAAL